MQLKKWLLSLALVSATAPFFSGCATKPDPAQADRLNKAQQQFATNYSLLKAGMSPAQVSDLLGLYYSAPLDPRIINNQVDTFLAKGQSATAILSGHTYQFGPQGLETWMVSPSTVGLYKVEPGPASH